RNDQLKRAVSGLKKAFCHRNAFLLIGVEQTRIGAALHHERELPREIVGVLQTSVHALGAGRTVNVGGIAEQEAASVAEPLRSSVMDALGGEPTALGEGQGRPRFLTDRRNHFVEGDELPLAQMFRQNADYPPAIDTTHWKEQVEAIAPQIDVELTRLHWPR